MGATATEYRKLDAQGRCNVPVQVRQALKLGPDDYLVFVLQENGTVLLKRGRLSIK